MGIRNEKLLDGKSPSYASILSGIAKGDYWLDDEKEPTLAVAYSYCVGGCGVTGVVDQKEAARDFFEHTVFPALKQRKIYEFEFSTEDDRLREQLLSIFSDKDMEWENEYSYRKATAVKGEFSVPNEYEIKKVDCSFFRHLYSGRIKDNGMLKERLKQSWKDEDTFLENSIAYVAIYESAIVGVIFGSAQYKKYITVDIETEEAHRGRKIATVLTKVFMDECVRKGYTAQWDHVESNQASAALAKKCGFELFKVRPFHWFELECDERQ